MRILILFLFLLSTIGANRAAAETVSNHLDEPSTVGFVDLNRYLGVWYEIASIPQSFSKGCHCTRAKYSLDEDGDFLVSNSCNKDSVSGPLSIANGHAVVVDESSNAKLKVSFFWPFYGDYWIVGLDKNYRYAVISNAERSTLWILSRTPVLSKNLLNEALVLAKAKGLAVNALTYTQQQGCRYP